MVVFSDSMSALGELNFAGLDLTRAWLDMVVVALDMPGVNAVSDL